MLPYILRRVLHFIPTFLLATLLAFFITQAAPGDFLSQLKENPSVQPETIERLRQQFGLDQHIIVQYFYESFSQHAVFHHQVSAVCYVYRLHQQLRQKRQNQFSLLMLEAAL